MHERAVKQTPSCLASLVNPRIVYIPPLALLPFDLFSPPPLSLFLSTFPAALESLQRVLGFPPLGGIAVVPT